MKLIKINLNQTISKAQLKEIKEEQMLAKTRAAELKSFLKEEQKAIREKEKQKQRK